MTEQREATDDTAAGVIYIALRHALVAIRINGTFRCGQVRYQSNNLYCLSDCKISDFILY